MTHWALLFPFMIALLLATVAPAPTSFAATQPLTVHAQVNEPWATKQSDGWAIVDSVISPQVIQVRVPTGDRFRVWHVGVIGPTAEQSGGAWFRRATQLHTQLLPTGSKVWLEAQVGANDPQRGQWVYRHVFREKAPEAPIGAELLRSGMTWVFPHAVHPYVSLYADEQASAISTQAGLWAETQSSAIFVPEGATYGGFPINPRVIPALKALEASAIGREVLESVNSFPVEITVNRLQEGILGGFAFRYYSIGLNQTIMDAPPEAIAAVLLHELVHARQAINMGVLDVDMGCYEMEIEAFEVTARYWSDLHGPNGKRQTEHDLERTLNRNLRDYHQNRIAQNVRYAYGHQCGPAFRELLEEDR